MRDQLHLPEPGHASFGSFAVRMSVLLVLAIVILATASAISLSSMP